MTPNGARMFFPTNPELADILADTDLDFGNFYFWDFLGSQISGLGASDRNGIHLENCQFLELFQEEFTESLCHGKETLSLSIFRNEC